MRHAGTAAWFLNGKTFSEWKSSELIFRVIDKAKSKNALNTITFSLLYATDLADRLHNIILPALRAGLIVIADRYIYTAFARDVVRGADPKWVRKLYGFAVEPDLVFYMKMPLEPHRWTRFLVCCWWVLCRWAKGVRGL